MRKKLWLAPVTVILALVLAVTTSVTAQDELGIKSIATSPTSAKEGETVTVTVQIENSGSTAGTYSLVLKVEDEVKATEEVEVDPESVKTWTHELTEYETGDYIIDVNGASSFFTVTKSFWSV